LCQALAGLVTYQVIQNKKINRSDERLSKITEWFKKHKAGVEVEETTLSVGVAFS